MKKKILVSLLSLSLMLGPSLALADEADNTQTENQTIETNSHAEEVKAVPSGESVNFDGQAIELETYLINDENYIRLRDVAGLLRETDAKFDVDFDQELYSVLIRRGQAYGQEYEKSDVERKTETGIKSQQNVLVDSAKVDINGYLINDENYFRLRDLADVLNFGVAYDYANSTVLIDSSNPDLEDIKPIDALPSGEKIEYNGQDVSMNTYLIADENYVRLRDVAGLLAGSESQFAVGFDNDTKSVLINKGQTHDEKFQAADANRDKEKAIRSQQDVLIDGVKVDLKAYIINDENYFRLRDLGKALDFQVDYDEDSKTVIIKAGELEEKTPLEKLEELTNDELLKTEEGVKAAEEALIEAKTYVEGLETGEEKTKAEETLKSYEEKINRAKEVLNTPTVTEMEGQLVAAIDQIEKLLDTNIRSYKDFKAVTDAIDQAKKIAEDDILSKSTFRYGAQKDIEKLEDQLKAKLNTSTDFTRAIEDELKEAKDAIGKISGSRNTKEAIDTARTEINQVIEMLEASDKSIGQEVKDLRDAVNKADLEVSMDQIRAIDTLGIDRKSDLELAQNLIDKVDKISKEYEIPEDTKVELRDFNQKVKEVDLNYIMESARKAVEDLKDTDKLNEEKLDLAQKEVDKAKEILKDLPANDANRKIQTEIDYRLQPEIDNAKLNLEAKARIEQVNN